MASNGHGDARSELPGYNDDPANAKARRTLFKKKPRKVGQIHKRRQPTFV